MAKMAWIGVDWLETKRTIMAKMAKMREGPLIMTRVAFLAFLAFNRQELQEWLK